MPSIKLKKSLICVISTKMFVQPIENNFIVEKFDFLFLLKWMSKLDKHKARCIEFSLIAYRAYFSFLKAYFPIINAYIFTPCY